MVNWGTTLKVPAGRLTHPTAQPKSSPLKSAQTLCKKDLLPNCSASFEGQGSAGVLQGRRLVGTIFLLTLSALLKQAGSIPPALFSFSPLLFFFFLQWCYLYIIPLHIPEHQYLPEGSFYTHLVPQFLPLVTWFLQLLPRGCSLSDWLWRLERLCSWVPPDSNKRRFCS